MTIALYIFLVFMEFALLVSFLVYIATVTYSIFFGSFYVATKQKEVDIFLKEAALKKDQYFLELGSGDGRTLRTAAKMYQVIGKGIDINPVLTILARILTNIQHVKGIEFKTENVMKTELSQADVVYIFLMPKLIAKLEKRMLIETKKGALLISHGFELHAFKSKQTNIIQRKPFPTYFYKV